MIPTAVLPTHTGGFTGFTYRDLTEDIEPVVAHWRGLGLGFDAIYTGFLDSFEQMGIVSGMFDALKEAQAPGSEGTQPVADSASPNTTPAMRIRSFGAPGEFTYE